MNDWLKRIREQLKGLWSRWNRTQKLVLLSIVGASVLAIILLIALSGTPAMVALISSPVTNVDDRMQISAKLDDLQVKYQLRSDNIFYVADEQTARRVRMVLNEENLIPKGTDPWALFDVQSWTTTDFERNVNLQRAIQRQLTQHIMALDGVDNVSLVLQMPPTELFTQDQKPVSVSVQITPKPGSDLTTNRKKIEGIQRLIKLAVAGLKDENIVITDNTGTQLNDFTGMEAIDNVELAKKQLKLKADLETKYKSAIMDSLKDIFSPDRVRIPNIDIKFDMSKESSTAKTITPIAVNPGDKYTAPTYAPSVAISTQNTEEHFQGTGFNPEGPARRGRADAAGVQGPLQPRGQVRQDLPDLQQRHQREEHDLRAPAVGDPGHQRLGGGRRAVEREV